jgi:hypothetical protein
MQAIGSSPEPPAEEFSLTCRPLVVSPPWQVLQSPSSMSTRWMMCRLLLQSSVPEGGL